MIAHELRLLQIVTIRIVPIAHTAIVDIDLPSQPHITQQQHTHWPIPSALCRDRKLITIICAHRLNNRYHFIMVSAAAADDAVHPTINYVDDAVRLASASTAHRVITHVRECHGLAIRWLLLVNTARFNLLMETPQTHCTRSRLIIVIRAPLSQQSCGSRHVCVLLGSLLSLVAGARVRMPNQLVLISRQTHSPLVTAQLLAARVRERPVITIHQFLITPECSCLAAGASVC